MPRAQDKGFVVCDSSDAFAKEVGKALKRAAGKPLLIAHRYKAADPEGEPYIAFLLQDENEKTLMEATFFGDPLASDTVVEPLMATWASILREKTGKEPVVLKFESLMT